jgi:hypothetical protein
LSDVKTVGSIVGLTAGEEAPSLRA